MISVTIIVNIMTLTLLWSLGRVFLTTINLKKKGKLYSRTIHTKKICNSKEICCH